jgi:hypothetical protein
MSLASEFLKHGAITSFKSDKDLSASASRLREHGYTVHEVDAASRKSLTLALSRVLCFKERFGYEPWGGNLDALADAMYDLPAANTLGIVMAFQGPYTDRAFVDSVLEVLDEASAEARAHKQELIVLALADSRALLDAD